MEFVHESHRRAFVQALDLLPPAHLVPPESGELHSSRDEAVARLKDYAFSQGFVIVGEGGGADRAKLRCCRQGSGTQNNRKLTDEERKRNTKTQAANCPYKVYASYIKANKQ